MHNRLHLTTLAGCFALALLFASTAQSAPDDGEKTAAEAAQNQGVRLLINQVDQFDQWVFQGARNADGARSRIDRSLKLQLAALERKHQFSKDQRQKLELAARGDIKRLFDEVDELRSKFREAQNDNNQLGQMWQQIQPLQRQVSTGPFGPDSLFVKVLSTTLTAEQNAEQEAIRRERRAFRYRATIEVAVAMLEDTVPLTGEQRDKISELIANDTQPPAAFGQYDYYFVMYQLSQIKQSEIKALLDDRQWNQMRTHLLQMRGMRRMLIQQGVMAGDAPERNIPLERF